MAFRPALFRRDKCIPVLSLESAAVTKPAPLSLDPSAGWCMRPRDEGIGGQHRRVGAAGHDHRSPKFLRPSGLFGSSRGIGSHGAGSARASCQDRSGDPGPVPLQVANSPGFLGRSGSFGVRAWHGMRSPECGSMTLPGSGFFGSQASNHQPLALCSVAPCDRGNPCRGRRPAGPPDRGRRRVHRLTASPGWCGRSSSRLSRVSAAFGFVRHVDQQG